MGTMENLGQGAASGFIALAERGRDRRRDYLASLALILAFWLVLGSVPLVMVVEINGGMPFAWGDGPAAEGPLSGIDPFVSFYLPVAFSFIALFAGIAIAVRFIHDRPILTLITPGRAVNWGRIGLGFGIFLAFNVIANAAAYALNPGAFSLSIEPARLLLFAPIYVILTAIQTTGEELLFRGYLLQGAGRALKSPLAAALFSSALFMLVHLGNPEASAGLALAAAYYFCVGLWLCLITLRDGTSELAIGAHAANNMFILVLNYRYSALEMVPSVFKMGGTDVADMALSLGLFLIMAAAAYLLLFRSAAKRAG